MLRESISCGEADATHHAHPSVPLISSESSLRLRAESLFESLTPLHPPAISFSASASGTLTAAA
jgi:hypothetical protein